MPIYEPGLEEMVKRNRAEKRLEFTTDLPRAVRAASIVFIAVGTPQHEDGSADLSHVLGVARDIAKAMNGYKVIVDKSTVPVGTAARVRELMRRETSHPFSVVSNPEFLKQGAAVEDFLKPDRVVIGVEDDRARALMVELYAPFTRTGAPIMVMDLASAELCKYAANAILATRISFMNEVANVCEAFGAERRSGAQGDRRRSPHRAVVSVSRHRIRRQLLSERHQGAHQVLRRQGLRLSDAEGRRARQRSAESPLRRRSWKRTSARSRTGRSPCGACRSSRGPTTCARRRPFRSSTGCCGARAKVQAFDPQAKPVAKRIFGNKITLADKSYSALKGADALVIATEWSEFREPDFGRMRKLMKTPVIFDGRNIYSPEQMKAQGFTYYSVGR